MRSLRRVGVGFLTTASATTFTVAVGDLNEEEEPWVSPYDSDLESKPDDAGFSSSSD